MEMTFEKLYDLIENNSIRNKTDLLIIEKILEAEGDWIKPLDNLDEFVIALENEIKGETTKTNLERQIVEYTKDGFITSAWNTESITTLIEIFDLTQDENLKTTFKNLQTKISAEEQNYR